MARLRAENSERESELALIRLELRLRAAVVSPLDVILGDDRSICSIYAMHLTVSMICLMCGKQISFFKH